MGFPNFTIFINLINSIFHTWSCWFSPFNFSARPRILSLGLDWMRPLWSISLFSQMEDTFESAKSAQSKFWIIFITKSTCCSMMSLLIIMISLYMLACSSRLAWNINLKTISTTDWCWLQYRGNENAFVDLLRCNICKRSLFKRVRQICWLRWQANLVDDKHVGSSLTFRAPAIC